MRLFMYFMNRENPARWCGGSKAAPFWVINKRSPWGIKLYHHYHQMVKFPNAGWHFNTMGGMETALEKWILTGPIYYNGAEQSLIDLKNNPELLKKSFFSQVAYHTVLVPIDPSYPKYFLDNVEHFRQIGWLDEDPAVK